MMPLSRRSLPGSTNSSALPTPLPNHTAFAEPYRPAAPNLGRSVSEPRCLALLAQHPVTANASDRCIADFTPHQIPTQGVHIRRPRSATIVERMSPLHTRHASEGAVVYWQSLLDDPTRGRSPGPAQSTTTNDLGADVPAQDTPDISEERLAGDNGGLEVSHCDLGLRELVAQGNIRRGRSARARARGARGSSTRRRVSG
jgi:hypothetical protein